MVVREHNGDIYNSRRRRVNCKIFHFAIKLKAFSDGCGCELLRQLNDSLEWNLCCGVKYAGVAGEMGFCYLAKLGVKSGFHPLMLRK